jgi:2-polyprenyl-3-methyl-5-hydroxy-6-metoxy-1,4-benzoquinol methylase
MTKETLKKHYERKYSSESSVSSVELIRTVTIPTSRFEAVVKFFPMYFKGGDIIEFGAGNGNVAKTLLKSELKIASYTLGDISLSRLKGLLRNLEDGRVTVLPIDAEDIPESADGNYDAIIMIALIEHLIDPLGAMQRIRQLLKPGGFVYIDTPNIAKYTQRVKLLLGRFPSTSSMNEGLTTYSGAHATLYDEGHLHYFTYRSLSLMLTERCGFSRVVKLGYPAGRNPLGKHVHNYCATFWPELFSELAIIAYA